MYNLNAVNDEKKRMLEKLKKFKIVLIETKDSKTGRIKSYQTNILPKLKIEKLRQEITIDVTISSNETEEESAIHELYTKTRV